MCRYFHIITDKALPASSRIITTNAIAPHAAPGRSPPPSSQYTVRSRSFQPSPVEDVPPRSNYALTSDGASRVRGGKRRPHKGRIISQRRIPCIISFCRGINRNRGSRLATSLSPPPRAKRSLKQTSLWQCCATVEEIGALSVRRIGARMSFRSRTAADCCLCITEPLA